MSSCKNHPMQCPQCGALGDFTIWDSVNTDLNPDFKNKIISGELFQWKCPQCGRIWTINYPMMYHDMSGRKIIEFRPTPLNQPRNENPNKGYAIFQRMGYTIRYAYTQEEFLLMVRGKI